MSNNYWIMKPVINLIRFPKLKVKVYLLSIKYNKYPSGKAQPDTPMRIPKMPNPMSYSDIYPTLSLLEAKNLTCVFMCWSQVISLSSFTCIELALQDLHIIATISMIFKTAVIFLYLLILVVHLTNVAIQKTSDNYD